MTSNIETFTNYGVCYIRNIEDNSVSLIQYSLTEVSENPKLKFGPLYATLDQLFDLGFRLEVTSHIGHKYSKLILTSEQESYYICKQPFENFLKSDLTWFVKNKKCFISRFQQTQLDPFIELQKKYPKSISRITSIGNQSIENYVKTQLQSHRNIQYE